MPERSIILVAGLGRCGSSLVMQMLAAGGIPATGTARYPSYEDPRTLNLTPRSDWLGGARGHAVKVLDPHRYYFPKGLPYRAIWCDRDPIQQSRSQAKFARWIDGTQISRNQRRMFARDIRHDRDIARRYLALICGAPPLDIDFEVLINEPVSCARRIARFADCPSPAGMDLVVRRRTTKCLSWMLEEDLAMEDRALVSNSR